MVRPLSDFRFISEAGEEEVLLHISEGDIAESGTHLSAGDHQTDKCPQSILFIFGALISNRFCRSRNQNFNRKLKNQSCPHPHSVKKRSVKSSSVT